VEEFIEVMSGDLIGSRAEADCVRFDLLRDNDNPCKFACYEIWASPEGLKAHMDEPHTKAWGAFQYGEKQPVVSKAVFKATPVVDLQAPTEANQELGICLQIEIKEEHVEEFIEVMSGDLIGSRAEADCVRFDLLRDNDNPCKFACYEIWASPEGLKAHMDEPHTKAWGAFQYGEKQPVVSKAVFKGSFQKA